MKMKNMLIDSGFYCFARNQRCIQHLYTLMRLILVTPGSE